MLRSSLPCSAVLCRAPPFSAVLRRILFNHKRTGEPADASSPVCSEERKNYFFFAAFLAGFFAAFFFAAFFLAAIVLAPIKEGLSLAIPR